MLISADDDWLDNAAYPVILDPTIGYDTLGDTLATATDSLYVNRFSCSADGTTASATFYVGGEQSAESEARGCVYADNSGTAASQAKLSSNESEIPDMKAGAGAAWNDGTLTPPAFSNGTDYFVGVHVHSSKLRFNTVTAGYEDGEWVSLVYNPGNNDLPANFDASPNPVAREYSYYIDYTEAAAGAAGQVIFININ